MSPRFAKDLTRKSPPGRKVKISGRWRNELGSEMKLTVKDGEVRGTYRTAVGEVPKEETFKLCGFAKGDLIVFCVNFGAYGSVAAWAGQYAESGSKERILTLWHLARNAGEGNEPKQAWSRMLTGADVFRRV